MPVSFDRNGVETAAIHDLVDFTDKEILEVGCGDGRLTWRYAWTASGVVGLDVNEKKIRAAIAACPEELRPKVTFKAEDIGDFNVGANSFDVAILSYSL